MAVISMGFVKQTFVRDHIIDNITYGYSLFTLILKMYTLAFVCLLLIIMPEMMNANTS